MNILTIILFTFVIFAFFAGSLVFSKYRQRRNRKACTSSSYQEGHRCGHCVCDNASHKY